MPSSTQLQSQMSEEKVFTVPSPPQSMTRLSKMASPVTVFAPGKVSPVIL